MPRLRAVRVVSNLGSRRPSDALALTCHATRAALESVDAWALAGCALGNGAAARRDAIFRKRAGARARARGRPRRPLAGGERRRGGGGARRADPCDASRPGVRAAVPGAAAAAARAELAPLGLVAVRLDAAASTSSPPFVVVPVDPAFDAKGELRQGRGVCALPNCYDPARADIARLRQARRQRRAACGGGGRLSGRACAPATRRPLRRGVLDDGRRVPAGGGVRGAARRHARATPRRLSSSAPILNY